MYEIVEHQQFSDTTFLWQVYAPDVAKSAEPGHFIMLRLHEGGERLPLTVADFDREKGTVTLVVQAIGKSTEEMLQGYRKGDHFTDFAGPLGLPSEVEDFGHVVVVGGGLGVAPVFPQLRAFKEAGNQTTAIIGFRNKGLVFWEDEFRPHSDELIICTDDGSYGREGFVTAALKDVLEKNNVNRVIAVGPLPMMRACAEVSRPFGVPTVVSLNAIMVDGTGMCGSCRVTVADDIKFACVDGPEFDAHQVDFDELMQRQQRFKKEESSATEDYKHVCNLTKQLFDEGKRNYKKIKELEPEARKMPERDAAERATNFKEVNLGYGMDDALAEAERCLQCKRPTCIEGCPVSIDIPRFIRHLLIRDLDGARATIQQNNLFPSICGRVCPQESQCEAQCIIGKKVEPVAIGRLERFIGDNAPQGAPTAKKANGESLGKVAIVGSGPGGLACAADLALRGADVTIYEALHVVGGVLSYGIPAFRLPREIISREIQELRDLGVKIETNKVIGKTFTVEQLLDEMEFNAVFIATGAGYPSFLGIPGEHAGRVYSANEFLTRINLMGGDRFPYEDTPVSLGKSVVVLGAGNTAMDCLRVSKRLGAETVRCLYRRTEAEAPARIEEIRHAKEEGITFHWLRSPVEIVTDDKGDVNAIRCQEMVLGPPDDSGRRRPKAIDDAFETFDCDTVIYALGTRANPIIAQSTPGLDTRRGGYINVDEETQAANMPGVFAGGDIVTGGATVIMAMGAGRRAAAGIYQYLKTKKWPPNLEDAIPEAGNVAVSEKAVASAPAAEETMQCPKCRQPLEEGEGEYICCADATVSWHCTQCQKVSEGFAFPYGLCAACGGKLAIDHQTDTESKLSQDAIRHAFEIEMGGMSFYQKGAEMVSDPHLKDLFSRLVTMEEEHMKTLCKRYHIKAPVIDGPSLAQVAVYADEKAPSSDGDTLLRLAIRLEKRARDFFAGRSKRLEEGTPEWRLYRELEAEEQEHVDLLTTELARWQSGKGGVL
jgi:glutamate synthase (NADPH) small chain